MKERKGKIGHKKTRISMLTCRIYGPLRNKKEFMGIMRYRYLAEREGFEPSIEV